MEKKISAKAILIPTIVLFAICLAASGILALTDSVTREKIAAIDAENKAAAMSVVLPDAATFGEEGASEDGKITYAPALDESGAVIGYAVSVTVQGYGGDIDVMTGVRTDGSIGSVTILAADDETPGLGQNTRKPAFLSQFDGKSGILTVVKNAVSSDSEIQAVTSATISSRAVTLAVNNCLDFFENELKEGV